MRYFKIAWVDMAVLSISLVTARTIGVCHPLFRVVWGTYDGLLL